MNNLIFRADHQTIADRMRAELFSMLEKAGGMQIPLFPDVGGQYRNRHSGASHAVDFPEEFYKLPQPGSHG